MTTSLREWQLKPTQVFPARLAADARLSRTDYIDDQIWELAVGQHNEPALALKTTYGGRAGRISLIPMWQHNGRAVYEAQGYAVPFTLTSFAPGYLRAEGQLTLSLHITAEYRALESHAVGARFTVRNTGSSNENLTLEMLGYTLINRREERLKTGTLRDDSVVLLFGLIGNLQPALMLENGQIVTGVDGALTPRLGARMHIPAGSEITTRWVTAGLPDVNDSANLAFRWLHEDWTPHFDAVNQAAEAIPQIFTGDDALDLAIAASYQQLIESFLRASGSLPFASFVARRDPRDGYSARGNGADYTRGWSGQPPQLAYLAALGVATVDAELAQGVVRNYLAVQQDDGWIDRKPGLGGQRENLICTPLLARLAWEIYQYTEDRQFLSDVFQPLLKFFNRWFAADVDADQDGLPEWQQERQTGYVYQPTFGIGQIWAQNADIHYVETPDLAAYLLSEAESLGKIAEVLSNEAAKGIEQQIQKLQAALDEMWRENHFAYRERDSHVTTSSVSLFSQAPGDEEQILALPLTPPNRIIVRVEGAVRKPPSLKLTITGFDQQGQEMSETVDEKAFVWSEGFGVYTSQNIYGQVDRVRFDGLVRLMRISARTVGTDRLDINGVLPLWAGKIASKQAKALIKTIRDEAHFWRTNGVTMTSASDPNYDPSNANGGGGVWPFWVTVIGEALLAQGEIKTATELVKRLIKVQTAVYQQTGAFKEFYHADQPQGSGETGNLGGVIPLHLLLKVFGVKIINSGRVVIDGAYAWGDEMTIKQYGVEVRRTKAKTSVKFPSGYQTTIENEAAQQIVNDPNPTVVPEIAANLYPAEPLPSEPAAPDTGSISIPVDFEDSEGQP